MKEITLEYLVTLLIRRLVFMLLAAVVFAAAAFGYCKFFMSPVYRATSQILVSNGAVITGSEFDNEETKISGSDIQSSMYLAKVCVEVLEAQEFYKSLAQKLENKYSYSMLDSFISVSLKREDSLFINISVNHTDPAEAKKIANTMVAMAPDYIKGSMSSAKVMITATADATPKVAPRTVITTGLFFVIGAALVYFISFIIDLNDKTIKGVADLTEGYNIPLLGSVPDFENNDLQGGYSYAESK